MWDALLKALGSALSFFYDVIPSYGVAIILLTITARILLLPLTIKQTRSMHEMQKIQPQLKAIQQKYKGNRQKVSEETMKLYKEHKVNPLGGCLPLVLQFPIFIALFSVLRATIPAAATAVEPIPDSMIGNKEVFCYVPDQRSTEEPPPEVVSCDTDGDGEDDDQFEVQWPATVNEQETRDIFTVCDPVRDEESGDEFFACLSTVGSGHLPRESDLFQDIVEDRAQFLGLHLSCGATQVTSEDQIRTCAPPGTKAGGGLLVGYYGLIAMMVLTTWYQTRQMQQTSQAAPQMQMMGRIMPIFLGFISLSIPAGVLVYWVTTNLWQVGQQHVMLRSREQQAAAPMRGGASLKQQSRVVKNEDQTKEPAKPQRPPQRSGSKNARSRKKRRKR